MKSFLMLLASLILIVEGRCETNTKFCFEATYSEGFGVVMKRSFVVKKYHAEKGTKREGQVTLGIDLQKADEDSCLALECSPEVLEALGKALGADESVKVIGIGYETIISSGAPSIGESASAENIMIPPSIGWHVKKVFVLQSFVIAQ